MTIVFENTWFEKPNGTFRRKGFFLDPTLKANFDNYLIKGVKSGHDGIVVVTGLEGCQPKGNKVLLSNGTWKNIENIKVGDKVLSPQKDGTYTFSKVLSTTKWFCDNVYDVQTLNRGQKKLYSCSNNHLIPIDNGTNITAENFYRYYDLFLLNGYNSYYYNKKTQRKEKILIHLTISKAQMVYGFELESKSKWYITDNWMITHNTGKSTYTQTLAAYVSNKPQLNIDNVLFSGKDLMTAIDNAPPETPIIFDEAIMDMSSQDFSSQMQKILIKKFTLIRKKRLYIFIVIPSLFMLRKYFAIFRTRAMINCVCPDGMTRGFFRFYSFSTKKKLYLKGMKEMNMGSAKCDFSGRFVDTYGFHLDAEAYEAKKDDAIKKLTEDKDSPEDKLKESFEDYKLKLKLDVEKFKSDWKEKFNEQRMKYTEQVNDAKKQMKDKVDDIKVKAITLQKSNDKKRIEDLQLEQARLMFFTYNYIETMEHQRDVSSEFTPNMLKNLLVNQNILQTNTTKIQRLIKEGKNSVEIETALKPIE